MLLLAHNARCPRYPSSFIREILKMFLRTITRGDHFLLAEPQTIQYKITASTLLIPEKAEHQLTDN